MRVLGLITATGAGVSVLIATAAAADPPQRLSGAPGVPVPLMVETGEHSDCTVGDTPQTRVLVAPAHGELAYRQGDLRKRGSACPAAPGYVVLYVPDQDFNGDDMISIEVREGGRMTTLDFNISVSGKIPPPDDAT